MTDFHGSPSRYRPLNTDDKLAGSTSERTTEPVTSKQSRIITKVLSPAMRLWLRSQVEQVSDLEVKISGSDRQILSGHIPLVSILARHAVYQGLHLRQIQLTGESIRINLGQVLKGQPLRLLEPVPVYGCLLLQESDLNASFCAPMLANALTEFLLILLQSGTESDFSAFVMKAQPSWQNTQIEINAGQVTLSATLVPSVGNPMPIVIRTGLQMASSHELELDRPQISTQQGFVLDSRDSLKVDLGSEVAIDELTLTPGQLICYGRINVLP